MRVCNFCFSVWLNVMLGKILINLIISWNQIKSNSQVHQNTVWVLLSLRISLALYESTKICITLYKIKLRCIICYSSLLSSTLNYTVYYYFNLYTFIYSYFLICQSYFWWVIVSVSVFFIFIELQDKLKAGQNRRCHTEPWHLCSRPL